MDSLNELILNGTDTILNASMQEMSYGLDALLTYKSVILSIAVLIEMLLPIPKSLRLDKLQTIFVHLGSKVNLESNSQSQRYFSGLFLSILIFTFFLLLCFIVGQIANYDGIISIIILVFLLRLKESQDFSLIMYRNLRDNNKEKCKAILQKHVLRDTSILSTMGIAKATCDNNIITLFSSWYAIMVWYLIGNIPMALIMALSICLIRSFNTKLTLYKIFGQAIMRIEQALLLLPCFIISFFLCIGLHPIKTLQAGFYGAQNYGAFCTGFILGAIGQKLNLSIAGPRFYNGQKENYARLGGFFSPTAKSILKSFRLMRFEGILLILSAIVIDFIKVAYAN